jgi:anti-sigma factor RsiW
MSKHRPDSARLGAYLAGDLAAPKRREVEAHLAGCEDCSTALRRMRNARRLLVEEFGDDAAPAPARHEASGVESWQALPPRLRQEIESCPRSDRGSGGCWRRRRRWRAPCWSPISGASSPSRVRR